MPVPTQYISNYGFLGFSVKETTFGTPVAATKYFKFESETFETDPGFKPVPTIGGTRAENNLSYGDEIHAAGGVVLPFGPLNGPLLLAFALGNDAISGAGPYIHTMTPNESGIPSFTVEKNLGGLTSQQYAGCVVNKFDLEAMTNAPCRATLDLLPQIDVTPFTATTPSYVADTPFALADYSVSIFGSANTNVLRMKLSVDNGAKNVFTFSGHRYSTLNYSSARIITGETEVILQSMGTQYTDAMAGTYGALSFTMSQGASASCVIDCTKIQWGKPQQALRRGELITQVLPFTAFLIAGQSYDIRAVVTNTVSTSYLA